MSRRQRMIVACAAVLAVAGATAAVAQATVADRTATTAYRSEVTITLDAPDGTCATFPDADGSGRPHRVCGAFLTCYRDLDGPQGPLGLPTGDERPNRYQPDLLGERVVPFSGGSVYLRDETGELSVGRWYVSTPSSASEPPEPVPQC